MNIIATSVIVFTILQYLHNICGANDIWNENVWDNSVRFAKKSESQWFKLVSICVKSFEYGTVTTIPICSGVLIAKEYVLTSAHCTFEFIDPDSVRVELGSTYLPYAHSYRIETWTTYKLWAKENSVEVRSIDHDIAIIKLLEKVNPSIKPAVITKNPNEFFYNKTVETVFWGVKNRVPGFTKIGALDVISNDECTKILTNSPLLSKNVTLDPTVFCTKLNHGVVFENVDSGSPLLKKQNELIAINDPTYLQRQGIHIAVNVNFHLGINYYKKFIKDVTNKKNAKWWKVWKKN